MNKTQKYNHKRLSEYALWYYERYLPSDARLREKLEEKAQSREVFDQVWSQVSSILVEDRILEDKVKNLLNRKKNQYYIVSNLAQK